MKKSGSKNKTSFKKGSHAKTGQKIRKIPSNIKKVVKKGRV